MKERRRSLLRRAPRREPEKDRDEAGNFELPSYFVEVPPPARVPDAPNREDV